MSIVVNGATAFSEREHPVSCGAKPSTDITIKACLWSNLCSEAAGASVITHDVCISYICEASEWATDVPGD